MDSAQSLAIYDMYDKQQSCNPQKFLLDVKILWRKLLCISKLLVHFIFIDELTSCLIFFSQKKVLENGKNKNFSQKRKKKKKVLSTKIETSKQINASSS